MRVKSLTLLGLISSFVVISAFTGCAPSTTVKKKQAVTIEKPSENVFIPPKKKISVIEFENKTAYGQRRLGTAASDILLTELGKSQKFILIEKKKKWQYKKNLKSIKILK